MGLILKDASVSKSELLKTRRTFSLWPRATFIFLQWMKHLNKQTKKTPTMWQLAPKASRPCSAKARGGWTAQCRRESNRRPLPEACANLCECGTGRIWQQGAHCKKYIPQNTILIHYDGLCFGNKGFNSHFYYFLQILPWVLPVRLAKT